DVYKRQHQGAFDISFLRCIPDMVIMTPSDENECRQMPVSYTHLRAHETPKDRVCRLLLEKTGLSAKRSDA
ncbi:hypothetical protein, partial [Enterobacter hormaechei]|uniref:hypothetical protein n=1 Tax=Enterobacter hormaechei TaxID=158836 RepID=UPI001D077FBC